MTAIDLLLAQTRVSEELVASFKGVEPRRVVISPPKRGTSVKYEGPELVELWMSLRLPYNPEQSTLKLLRSCEKCGRAQYEVLGVEQIPHEEKIGEHWERVSHKAREPGKGVRIARSTLVGADFFDFGDGYQLCTDRAKSFIESKGWTNITFLEYGEVI